MIQRQVFSPITVHVAGLAGQRGGMALFAGLSFVLAGGQALMLRGPNGAGKTTLLLTLAGMVAPAGGTIAVDSAEAAGGALLHFCGHQNAVKPRLSVTENLQFWATVNGPTGMSAAAALEQVGLGALMQIGRAHV